MTVSDLIQNAFVDAGILAAEGGTFRASQKTVGLSRLNLMLHSWDIEGITLDHVDLALTDTMPYEDSHNLAIQHNLGIILSGVYELDPPQWLFISAREKKQDLLDYHSEPGVLGTDASLHPYYNSNRRY